MPPTEGRQWTQRVELMRNAIIYNRNNPNVTMVEGGKGALEIVEAEIYEPAAPANQ